MIRPATTEFCMLPANQYRLIGTAAADGDYADIYSSGWIAHLRPKLADECLRLGLQDLDAAVLQSAALGVSANSLRDKRTSLAVLAFTALGP